MKVVLFCGGMGTRLGGPTDDTPKPMVKIGYRPILWHVMKYYAHYGHKDFILCLGYKADTIKHYFLHYDETHSNNFTMTRGGRGIELESSDIDDWTITFVDTGLKANIGERLKAVQPYLEGEDVFLANYSDGLTNLHLPSMIQWFRQSGKLASFLAVKPSQSFSVVALRDDQSVEGIRYVRDSDILINGGYFVFRSDIFHYMKEGEELVHEPFHRLIEENQLVAYRHDGFWCMDTFKEHQQLSDMHREGNAPWEVWKPAR
jgi:glucose-1-phosphate cytidylyltransferase